MEGKRDNRIPTLDGWRAIAIILVLFHHLQLGVLGHDAYFPWGGHGVTLFFVLSGFLITSNLMRELRESGNISLRAFYVRRFFRLMPAAWLYLLTVTSLVSSQYRNLPGHAQSLLGAIFFFRNYVDVNIHFWLTGHFWSLSIEEQFYLLWPALLVLFGLRLGALIAAVAACAIAAHRFIDASYLETLRWQATLGTELRADALLTGCFAALVLERFRHFLRAWFVWPLLAALAFCIEHYEFFNPLWESAVIALLLCVTSTFNGTLVARVLDWRPLGITGRVSYSLYLWQQLFLCYPGSATFSSAGWRIGLTVLAAWISYTYVEAPCNRVGHRIASRIKATHKRAEVPERPAADKRSASR
jgi:peptidoglycan/LPS O-acetylase OafA/YrhL